MKKYIWVRQPSYVMALLCVLMFTNILGTVVEVKQMSVKARWDRKKYMGVWRRGSEMIARMMSRFPRMVTRYMKRNRLKRSGCKSVFSASPRRINNEIAVWFPPSI